MWAGEEERRWERNRDIFHTSPSFSSLKHPYRKHHDLMIKNHDYFRLFDSVGDLQTHWSCNVCERGKILWNIHLFVLKKGFLHHDGPVLFLPRGKNCFPLSVPSLQRSLGWTFFFFKKRYKTTTNVNGTSQVGVPQVSSVMNNDKRGACTSLCVYILHSVPFMEPGLHSLCKLHVSIFCQQVSKNWSHIQ